MENSLFVLCTYAKKTAVTNLSDTKSFNVLINFSCRRWPNIIKDDVPLVYRLLGYNNCMLDNEDDLMSMINLAKLLKLHRVDVAVMVMETDSDTSNDESTKDGDCVDGTQFAEMVGMEYDATAKK